MILTNLEKDIENKEVITLINKLEKNNKLSKDEYKYMLDNISNTQYEYLINKACEARDKVYGKNIYLRALIEFSNYCKQDCLYCGIRNHNTKIKRYRLSKEEILDCCKEGYELDYRTFVLQSGEDPYYTDEFLVDLIKDIKQSYPDCALTLSIGEKPKETLKKFYEAGCDRYLLRHEAASERLYSSLHPSNMKLSERKQCLFDLKDIGYQVGCGLMVNSPTQTNDDLVEDLLFIQELKPQMCGIGPYLCHSDTPLKGNQDGTIKQTLTIVALVRLMLPKCLLPSTTALGTLHAKGREMALNAGANVLMPNVSPRDNRKDYEIYQNKICIDDTAKHCRGCIASKIFFTGYEPTLTIGHHKDFE